MSSTSPPLNSILLNVLQQLIRYVDSIFLIFGVTGCCLNILLFSRQQFHTSSCCAYLLVMNIAMVIHLIVALSLYLYGLNHVDPATTVVSICKIRAYIDNTTAMIYRWCLTVACFDRYALSSTDVQLSYDYLFYTHPSESCNQKTTLSSNEC